jgi:hypothetical protein
MPTDPGQPIAGTGRLLAGQRGTRLDYEDTELRALTAAGYVDSVIDAELVDEEED